MHLSRKKRHFRSGVSSDQNDNVGVRVSMMSAHLPTPFSLYSCSYGPTTSCSPEQCNVSIEFNHLILQHQSRDVVLLADSWYSNKWTSSKCWIIPTNAKLCEPASTSTSIQRHCKPSSSPGIGQCISRQCHSFSYTRCSIFTRT